MEASNQEYDQVTCIFMQISDERIIKEHRFAPVNIFRWTLKERRWRKLSFAKTFGNSNLYAKIG